MGLERIRHTAVSRLPPPVEKDRAWQRMKLLLCLGGHHVARQRSVAPAFGVFAVRSNAALMLVPNSFLTAPLRADPKTS
jgi:hypothetical protein